ASVACTALKWRLENINTGVAIASPRENCPTMRVLPSFARATIMPHWQIAYTTFPVRAQAKFDSRDRPCEAGIDWIPGHVPHAGRGVPAADKGRGPGPNAVCSRSSLTLTPDPGWPCRGRADSGTSRSAPDPSD